MAIAPQKSPTLLYILPVCKQFRQLGNIRRDPPRLVFGEQLGGRSPGGKDATQQNAPLKKSISNVKIIRFSDAMDFCMTLFSALRPSEGAFYNARRL
jgi:hypothetical protein